MTTTRTNKKTMCTFTCQVSRFMCTVLVLVVTSSLVSDVPSFGFTTHTQFLVFFLMLVVRLYLVIVNSDCSHNYCMLHIAETAHLRCCPYIIPRRIWKAAQGPKHSQSRAWWPLQRPCFRQSPLLFLWLVASPQEDRSASIPTSQHESAQTE